CERFFVTKRDMSFEENRPSRFKGRHRPKCPLAARGRSRQRNQTQAKPPAPPRLFNNLRTRWGRHFSLPDFCHGLLARPALICAETSSPAPMPEISAPTSAHPFADPSAKNRRRTTSPRTPYPAT